MKKSNYKNYCLNSLKVKPELTILSIILNVGIFGYALSFAMSIRGILNSLQVNLQGFGVLKHIIPYILMIVLFTIIRCFCIKISSYIDSARSYYFCNSLRINIFKGLFKTDKMKELSTNSSKAFECLDDDVPAANFPVELLTEVSGYVIYTILAIGALILINWKITVFIFIPLSIGLLVIKMMSDRIMKNRDENRNTHDKVSLNLADIINSVMSIKTMNVQNSIIDHYDEVNDIRRKAIVKDALFYKIIDTVIDTSSTLCIVVLMIVTAGLMTAGKFPLGDFAIFIYNLNTLNDCILRIIELVAEYKNSQVSFNRIVKIVGENNEELLNQKVELAIRQKVNLKELDDTPIISKNEIIRLDSIRELTIENLTSLYEDGRGVENISLSVDAGKILSLTGPVASGKTTVLNSLLGLIAKSSGKIMWNGQEIIDTYKQFKFPDVAVCMQSNKLLNATIRDNIVLGKDITDNECWFALKKCCLYDEVNNMPQGLDTIIGENGVMLSGGQRQRLLIARTMLCEAKLYILDDATNALNLEVEKEIYANLKEKIISSKAAAIIISNRESVMNISDMVVSVK